MRIYFSLAPFCPLPSAGALLLLSVRGGAHGTNWCIRMVSLTLSCIFMPTECLLELVPWTVSCTFTFEEGTCCVLHDLLHHDSIMKCVKVHIKHQMENWNRPKCDYFLMVLMVLECEDFCISLFNFKHDCWSKVKTKGGVLGGGDMSATDNISNIIFSWKLLKKRDCWVVVPWQVKIIYW